MANWQRGNPKKRGAAPKPMRKPKEERRTGLDPVTAADLQSRKQRIKAEMATRRKQAEDSSSVTVIHGKAVS